MLYCTQCKMMNSYPAISALTMRKEIVPKAFGRVYFGEIGDGQDKVRVFSIRCRGSIKTGALHNALRNAVNTLKLTVRPCFQLASVVV